MSTALESAESAVHSLTASSAGLPGSCTQRLTPPDQLCRQYRVQPGVQAVSISKHSVGLRRRPGSARVDPPSRAGSATAPQLDGACDQRGVVASSSHMLAAQERF